MGEKNTFTGKFQLNLAHFNSFTTSLYKPVLATSDLPLTSSLLSGDMYEKNKINMENCALSCHNLQGAGD